MAWEGSNMAREGSNMALEGANMAWASIHTNTSENSHGLSEAEKNVLLVHSTFIFLHFTEVLSPLSVLLAAQV